MALYLLPISSTMPEVTEVLSRAGVQLKQLKTVRELILSESDAPVVVGAVDPGVLLVLNRHAATLVNEVPTVVMSAPGAIYTGEWMTLASPFPAMDWTELREKLSKSGHLALTPGQLEARKVGGPSPTVESSISPASPSSWAPRVQSESPRPRARLNSIPEGDEEADS